jgi:hypothetical protein
MITARLEPSIEMQLALFCKTQGVSKTEVIAQSLRLFFEQVPAAKTPWQLGGHVVDQSLARQAVEADGAATTDRASRTGALYREVIRAKHARRRRSADRAV